MPMRQPDTPEVSKDSCSASRRTKKFHYAVALSSLWQIKYNSLMRNLKGLEDIVTELRAERGHLVNNLRHVDAALAVLGKLEGGKFATESRRTVSQSARRRMAASQKARWAKTKSTSSAMASGGGRTSRSPRRLSEATRRKIAAAQRARWARLKSK